MSKRLDKAIDKAAAARDRQALEDGVMHDHIMVGDVKLYRPTLIHSWVIGRLTVDAAKMSPFDLQLAIGYILAHDAEEVRNRISQEIRKRPAELPLIAEKFFVDRGAHPTETLEAINELIKDITKKKPTATPPGNPAGGQGPSTA